MKYLKCLPVFAVIVAACTDAADTSNRTNSEKPAVKQNAAATSQTNDESAAIAAANSAALEANVATTSDDAAKRMEQLNRQALKASPALNKDFDQQVRDAILKAFLEQQEQEPTVMTKEEATDLANKLVTALVAAKQNNPIQMRQSLKDFMNAISAIQAKKDSSLALYDNKTPVGRGLNGANGVVDLVVELYAAVLSLDIAAVMRVGSSAARLLTQLIAG